MIYLVKTVTFYILLRFFIVRGSTISISNIHQQAISINHQPTQDQGIKDVYPLVNIHTTMENCNFIGKSDISTGPFSIANCNKLPEGIPNFPPTSSVHDLHQRVTASWWDSSCDFVTFFARLLSFIIFHIYIYTHTVYIYIHI